VNYIDVRSDTVTWPTEAMRVAMASAPVGDDVYGDDPTMNELERLAAEMTGKEAAIFVPSGTFGNQLALFTWCPRGSEVILGEQCHIIQHEAGAGFSDRGRADQDDFRSQWHSAGRRDRGTHPRR